MRNRFCLRHWILVLTQASRLLACTVRNSLADRMARPHQNLPVTFFAWFRRISFPHWDQLERSDQKAHHPEDLRFGCEVGERRDGELLGCCVVVCYYFHLLGEREMNGGINGWWAGGGGGGNSLVWMELDGELGDGWRGRDGGHLM